MVWSRDVFCSKPGNVASENLCCDKSDGGLGFRNIVK